MRPIAELVIGTDWPEIAPRWTVNPRLCVCLRLSRQPIYIRTVFPRPSVCAVCVCALYLCASACVCMRLCCGEKRVVRIRVEIVAATVEYRRKCSVNGCGRPESYCGWCSCVNSECSVRSTIYRFSDNAENTRRTNCTERALRIVRKLLASHHLSSVHRCT